MVNTPIPHSLRSEARKAAKILRDFTVPSAKSGPDKLIPAGVIGQAKGLAILTVVKLGFLVTARGGSGIVIAKLDNGKWSAPSAIGIAGLGGGFEIGAEVTDFVIILNSKSAVDAFSKGGNLTLGGNFTVAVGPLGRNLEGDIAVRSPAAIYTYSKTKGIFAGISIEGSGLIERKDANKKFYGGDIRACSILSGEVSQPPECADLYEVLDKHDVMAENAILENRRKKDSKIDRDQHKHQDMRSEQTTVVSNRMKTLTSKERSGASVTTKTTRTITRTVSTSDGSALSRSQSMSIPSASLHPAPADTVTAIYDFAGQLPCDLTFQKGDTIAVLLRTDTQDDWWEGRVHNKTGIFPANYVEVHW